MPFKSEKQRRLFWAKVDRGEIAESKAREWERETKDKNLPERITKKEASAAAHEALTLGQRLSAAGRHGLSAGAHGAVGGGVLGAGLGAGAGAISADPGDRWAGAGRGALRGGAAGALIGGGTGLLGARAWGGLSTYRKP